MNYCEYNINLFNVPNGYYFAHCISADFRMGAGIAVEFVNRFDMRRILHSKYPRYLDCYINNKLIGDCILDGKVLNLITKERYYHKPTYNSLKLALMHMKKLCIDNGIKYVAMPKIGCGLDKLEWSIVTKIIQDIFEDTDITIAVCYIK